MATLGQRKRPHLTVEELQEEYPGLMAGEFQITSEETPAYNCVAYALGETRTPWWPYNSPPYYWPSNAPFEETVEAFVQVFQQRGS